MTDPKQPFDKTKKPDNIKKNTKNNAHEDDDTLPCELIRDGTSL